MHESATGFEAPSSADAGEMPRHARVVTMAAPPRSIRRPTNPERVGAMLCRILDMPVPPVARCRLLSSGFGEAHMLHMARPDGTCACLGCGSCIDACGLLAREPHRLERTAQRTSLALETMVGEECDRCENCLLACPQVDHTLKHYVVRHRLVEQMTGLLRLAGRDPMDWFDELALEAERRDRAHGAD